MKKTLLLSFVLLSAGAGLAQAQIKCWTDANGKRACGDAPPPGAKVSTLRVQNAPEAPPPAAAAAKGAAKGPLTAAEKEQDFRKRRQESEKAQEKAEKERQAKAERAESCERAKDAVRSFESGQRIARTTPSGERYFLDEAQVAQELQKARETAQKTCN